MRWRTWRLSRVALLTALLSLGHWSCSSSEQAEVDEVVSDDGEGEDGDVANAEEGDDSEMENQSANGENEMANNSEEEGEDEEEGEELGNSEENVDNALAETGVTQPSMEEATNGGGNAAAGGQVAMPAGPAGAIPEMNSKMPYVVRVGDTLAKVAQKIYGDQSKWQEMAELTGLENANRVRPGDVVYYRLSEQTMAFATAYEGAPRVSITVAKGDSLSKIAERVYGNSGDWKYVWRQNDIANPDVLEPGQQIVYLSPEALAAALDSITGMTIGKIAEVSAKVFGSQPAAEISAEMDAGFQMAKSMFEVYAPGFSG